MSNLVPLFKSSLIKPKTSSIIKADKLLAPKSSAIVKYSSKSSQTLEGDGILKQIQQKVIKIDKLLKSSLLLKKKGTEKKRVSTEQTEFEQREKDLEKNKPKAIPGIKLPSPPKLGIFDWIKNFIFNTLLGFVFVRLYEHLPKLLKLVPIIFKAGEFLIDVGGKLLNGLVTFIDWGYKAYDATRGFVKNIFGESGVKQFDNLMSTLNKLSSVIILASLAAAMPGGPGGGRGGGGGRPGRGSGASSGPYKYDPKRALVRKKYGDSAAKLYDLEIAKGKNSKQAINNIESRYIKKGRILPQRMTGSLGGTNAGSNVFGRGFARAPQRVAIKGLTATLGKGGAKAVLKFVKPLVSKIPIIGGLIEFGLSWALGEPIGKAAFRGIGSVLVGAIGTAIGGPIGAFLGAWAGGEAGGALYDMFFGNKNPQQGEHEVAKAAGGGRPATRGGKLVGGPAKRTLKKKKAPRTLRATPSKLKPGAAVGGEKNLKKFYPEPEDKKQMSPFGFLKNAYDRFSRSTGLDAPVALAIKSLMGDKPTTADYKNSAIGINNWMNRTVGSGTLAYAGGGEVKMESIVSGEDYSDVIAKSLQDSIAPQIDKTIQDLMEQMMLKPNFKKDPSQEGVTQPTGEGDILYGTTPGEYGPILDLIASVEAVGGYDVVNGGKIDGLSKMTISAARQAALSSGGSGAMGRYQQMPQYVLDRARSIGLNPDRDLFSPENQDKLAALLINGAGYKEWKSGNLTTERFAHRLSATWRGLPEGPSNKTYQDRYASRNKAHTSWANVMATLNAVKSGEISGGQFGGGILGTERVGAIDQFTPVAKKFGLQVTSSYRPGDPGYHGKNMARDYSNDSVGRGTPQQLAFAQHLAKSYGSSLKQLIYTPLGFGIANGKKVGLDYWGPSTNSIHYDHVHVAYAKGGKTKGVPHPAILGEEGREFVIDADSTAALENTFPGFLDAINKAKYKEAVNVLRKYTDYERPEPEIQYITKYEYIPEYVYISGQGLGVSGGGGSIDNNVDKEILQMV
jgi:muramidase (phage lysozyme)